ncbi:hypothetical protein SLS62_010477 [Diatrype stigma]|uniref:Polyketide synthase dehydratase domain-containing protein n=1 Tax=Diatrype stigma TaxID=117547 RepID=A0AAN9UGH9_9PEZI
MKSIKSVSGRTCHTIISNGVTTLEWDPRSHCPVHPVVLDGCLQTATSANAAGQHSLMKDTMIPAPVDDLVINKMPRHTSEGLLAADNGNGVLQREASSGLGHLVVARFHKDVPVLPPALQATLEVSGWSISTALIEKIATKVGPNSAVLVLDELHKPVLTGIGKEQWEALKELAGTGKPFFG